MPYRPTAVLVISTLTVGFPEPPSWQLATPGQQKRNPQYQAPYLIRNMTHLTNRNVSL